MISNQPRNRLHGQLDDTALSRSGKVGGREPLLINPVDAAARALAEGEIVRVFNARGSVLAGVRITDAIRPGVVQLATGSWYDPSDPARDGSTDKHGNPNVLTIDKGTSRLGQGPVAQTALVEVERAADAPPVTAYDPPKIARGVTP
jgi:biotin/methionine sulfoxide reductase